MNKCYQKSAQQAYNTTTQAYEATGTTLNLAGTVGTDCGCSIETNISNLEIESSGLYYISADVTSTPTAAGAQVIQFYNNGVAMPSSIATDTTTTGSTITQHIETIQAFSACCTIKPLISLRISGATGDVNYVRISAVKLA